MKWFGRKARRDESRPALSVGVARSGVPITGEWPRSYEAQAREAFGRNAVAQRAVKLVAESVAGAPLTASDPALAALVAQRSGGQALLESVAAQLLLHGNAYVQVLRDGEGGAAELFALRPDRVTVEVDAGGWSAAAAMPRATCCCWRRGRGSCTWRSGHGRGWCMPMRGCGGWWSGRAPHPGR